MKKVLLALMAVVIIAAGAAAEEKVLYSYETGLEGWEIPDWAYESDDYVSENIEQSKDYASQGKQSLKVNQNFPGKRWTASIVEIMEYLDLTPYTYLSCDVMVPKDAPSGLRAKLIVTVGDNWTWVEMSKTIKLEPGVWTTISANLRPGSMDWKRTNPDDEWRADIRKVDIRIESNRKPEYNGPIYIDNVRVE